jgi:NADPH:quinone reductase-like Zn-dependent oxidoreductase
MDKVVKKTMQGSFIHSVKSPLYMGWHYSGVVETVGDKVANLRTGNAVFGFLPYSSNNKQGSFSEYILVKEEECAVKPDNVSFKVAAASATECVTALQALRDRGELKRDQSVMIVGAGGGVGSPAVAIAKQLGAAHVTAICGTKDVEKVRALLKVDDEVVDRNKVDPLQTDRKFHVIFDTPSVYSFGKCSKLLEGGGIYVTTLPSFGLFTGMFLSKFFGSKKARLVAVESKREDLELVGNWLASGDLSIPIDSTYPARDMKAAVERYSSKEKNGRVVIDVQDGF